MRGSLSTLDRISSIDRSASIKSVQDWHQPITAPTQFTYLIMKAGHNRSSQLQSILVIRKRSEQFVHGGKRFNKSAFFKTGFRFRDKLFSQLFSNSIFFFIPFAFLLFPPLAFLFFPLFPPTLLLWAARVKAGNQCTTQKKEREKASKWRNVPISLVRSSGSAPSSSSKRATSKCPFQLPQCSAVHPSLSTALIGAPWSSSSRTLSTSPLQAAPRNSLEFIPDFLKGIDGNPHSTHAARTLRLTLEFT